MGIFSKIFSGLFKSGKNTLLQDIYTYSEWIVTALNTSGYKADYTVDSMKELDRFIDEQNTETGIMAGKRGQIIFAMGAYIGQTVIKNYGGEWITDDDNPKGELEIMIKLPDGSLMWPVQKCIKRCQLGAEESLYSYLRAIPHIIRNN